MSTFDYCCTITHQDLARSHWEQPCGTGDPKRLTVMPAVQVFVQRDWQCWCPQPAMTATAAPPPRCHVQSRPGVVESGPRCSDCLSQHRCAREVPPHAHSSSDRHCAMAASRPPSWREHRPLSTIATENDASTKKLKSQRTAHILFIVSVILQPKYHTCLWRIYD